MFAKKLTFSTCSEVTSATIYFFIFLFFLNFPNKDFLFRTVLSFLKLKMKIKFVEGERGESLVDYGSQSVKDSSRQKVFTLFTKPVSERKYVK